jgi:hypothetical protein
MNMFAREFPSCKNRDLELSPDTITDVLRESVFNRIRVGADVWARE